jgi:2-polyprenyl-3-methyl-5-hydroxy-6-metoxy-1,4-benzoquinol methylase
MESTFYKCLLCNNSDISKMSGYEKDNLVKCSKCGFVFSSKIPSMDELLLEYSKYARSNKISDITVKRYHEILALFSKYKKSNNIIDIGAGDGHFIDVANTKGWNSYATEFDDESVNLCKQKGVITHKGKLDVNNYKNDMFDVIYSSEVLEHINNPIEEINNFRKILRQGGCVYITTPNLNSFSCNYLKAKWNIFNYPEHLCYYTPSTLEKLFIENGFKKVWITTTGFSINRLVASKGNTLSENKDENLRLKMEKNYIMGFAKKIINFILNSTKKGDAMKGLFIKM